MTTTRISHQELLDIVVDIFTSRGMTAEDSQKVADVLVWAELSGHSSHGVARVERYLGFAERGDLDLTAKPVVTSSFGAVRRIDARKAAGAVALHLAVQETCEAALAYGIGMSAVANTTHIGAAGYYAGKLAQQGLISIVCAAGGPLMAYIGTANAAVSTAPYAFAVPMTPAPLVLDMASSAAALGKIREAARNGEEIPSNWALDASGNPTCDPQAAKVIQPMSGAKGSGLALLAEALGSCLASAPILAPALTGASKREHKQNATIIAINVAQLLPIDEYKENMAALAQALKAQPRREGCDEILVPGERSARTRIERSREGIPLKGSLLDSLRSLALQRS